MNESQTDDQKQQFELVERGLDKADLHKIKDVAINAGKTDTIINKLLYFTILHSRSTTKYFCKSCKDFIIGKRNFLDHFETVHQICSPSYPLACPVTNCKQSYDISNRKILGIHVETVHLGKLIKCKLCAKEFKFHNVFQLHLKQHKSGVKLFCSVCRAPKLNDLDLCSHFEMDHSINVPEYPLGCSVIGCLVKFKLDEKDLLEKHMRFRHADELSSQVKPIVQNISVKQKNDNLLKADQIAKKCRIENFYFCKLCDEIYVTEQKFIRHSEVVHSLQTPFLVCPVYDCVTRFGLKAKEHFVSHIRSIHLGYNFKCNFCDKLFDENTELTKHEHAVHQVEMSLRLKRKYDGIVEADPKKTIAAFLPEPSQFIEINEDDNTESQSTDDSNNQNELAIKIDCLMSFIYQSKNESFCNVCKQFFPQLSTYSALKRHFAKEHLIITDHPYMCPVAGCNFVQTIEKVTLLKHVDSFHLGGYFQKNILSKKNQTFENFCDSKVELVIDLDDDENLAEESHISPKEAKDCQDSDDCEVIVFEPEDEDEYQ